MSISRRDFLVGLGALGMGGCSPTLREARKFESRQPIRRVIDAESWVVKLNRLGMGSTPEQCAAAQAMGWKEYVERQLAAKEEEPATLQAMLQRMDIFSFGAIDLRALPERHIERELMQAAILRATYSPNQLRERMVDFWTNHFNIDSRKAYGAFYLSADQQQVIRAEALGSFPKMLRASAKSPAMLGYLDNKVNAAGQVNENYGRELLELHSLGVHGGYTQQDVREVARCFTGWTVEDRFLKPKGSFRFDASRHEKGAKEVLGHTIQHADGEQEGEMVLRVLASHPSTAKHLARKLCGYFLGRSVPELEAEVAAAYLRSNGDIPSMLRPILFSDNFAEPSVTKPRRPFDYLVACLRVTGAITDGGPALQEQLVKMRQPLYQWPMPDGYPEQAASWTGSLLPRWNFAIALAHGRIAGTELGLGLLAQRLGVSEQEALFISAFGKKSPKPAAPADSAKMVARVLCDPAFQWV